MAKNLFFPPTFAAHELLHNFGCGHDRYNAFSNAGTYYCRLKREENSIACCFILFSAPIQTAITDIRFLRKIVLYFSSKAGKRAPRT
jgi:hypothetical protein